MKIGSNIINLRKQKGVTQEQLARALGVSAAAVSKWETQQSCPDIAMLPPLARYFGITVDELLSFEQVLPEEEINHRVKHIVEQVRQKGHVKTMEDLRELVREYPNSAYLKIRIAGMMVQYALCLDEAERKEEYLTEYKTFAMELLEQADERGNHPWREQVRSMLASYYVQAGEFEKAEDILKEFKPPLVDANSLYMAMYLTQKKYDQAEQIAVSEFMRHRGALMMAFMSRMEVAWGKQDFSGVNRMADVYIELCRLLGFSDTNGYEMKLRVCVRDQDREGAERIITEMIRELLSWNTPDSGDCVFETTWNLLDRESRRRLLETYELLLRTEPGYEFVRDCEGYAKSMTQLREALEQMGREPQKE